MKLYSIEQTWITKAGLPAIVLYFHATEHRCGYVLVPPENKHYEQDYSELWHINVHGGLTFGEHMDDREDIPKGFYLGFDCAHYSDKTTYNPNGEIRTRSFVIGECESLAQQLMEDT